MTVQNDIGGAPTTDTDDEASKSARVTDAAMAGASTVASTAVESARDVASEAGTQAKALAGEAKQQIDRLVSDGRAEFRQQAEQRSAQAAGQLRTLSEQFSALVDGRPQDAGPLVGYVNDLQSQVRTLASRVEQGGPEGIVEDVTRFARRRPGIFLAGAVGVGFAVGRAIRAGVASQQDAPQSQDQTSEGRVWDETAAGDGRPATTASSLADESVTTPSDGAALADPTPLAPPNSEGMGS